MIYIKKADEGDYCHLLSLWENIPGVRVREDDNKVGYLRLLSKNSDFCYVAYDNNELIGSVLCGVDGKKGYLYHLAVNHRYQRKKIATQLLNTVFGKLIEINIYTCSFVVFKSNYIGKAFWEKLGATNRIDLDYYDLSFESFSHSLTLGK